MHYVFSPDSFLGKLKFYLFIKVARSKCIWLQKSFGFLYLREVINENLIKKMCLKGIKKRDDGII